jgi:hypothetical protein
MELKRIDKKNNFITLVVLLFIGSFIGISQVTPGIYVHNDEKNGVKTMHQLKVKEDYLIYTVFEKNPPNYIKTLGGFYKTEQDQLMVDLEFNSNYETDSLKAWSVPYRLKNNTLILQLENEIVFEPTSKISQDLDGAWLFATRGPDEGQDRRGEDSSRKTLKFLKDGTFQWIAYDTDSFRFSGTGGGSYSTKNGVYTEQIEFFSRDNARVGATLKFDYEIKGTDWHHTGNNTKGEPMYEIWARR